MLKKPIMSSELVSESDCNDQMKIPDSRRILVTGVTSIHGWPIFTQLNELLPETFLYGLRPPRSNVPDSDNVSSFCITERAEL